MHANVQLHVNAAFTTCLLLHVRAHACLALQIDVNAPFSLASKSYGWNWAVSYVGVSATLGTITSTMMSLLGQARYMTMIGRSHLVPLWFAKVNSYTSTPVNATVFLCKPASFPFLSLFSSEFVPCNTVWTLTFILEPGQGPVAICYCMGLCSNWTMFMGSNLASSSEV